MKVNTTSKLFWTSSSYRTFDIFSQGKEENCPHEEISITDTSTYRHFHTPHPVGDKVENVKISIHTDDLPKTCPCGVLNPSPTDIGTSRSRYLQWSRTKPEAVTSHLSPTLGLNWLIAIHTRVTSDRVLTRRKFRKCKLEVISIKSVCKLQ